MLLPSSHFRKGIVALALVVLVICATEVNAKRPIIIVHEFARIGLVSGKGRVVRLQMVGRGANLAAGHRIVAKVTVFQPSTGARAVGSGPIANTNTALATALPGPSFRPGPVRATSRATLLFRGKVVRTWTWTSTVILRAR